MKKKHAKEPTNFDQLITDGWIELEPIRNGVSILAKEGEEDIFILELNNHHWATQNELDIINENRKLWQDKPAFIHLETS